MKKNMGTVDRIIRVVISIIILVLYAAGVISGTVAIILLVLSGIFILTSLMSFCPLYLPLGLSTCKAETKE